VGGISLLAIADLFVVITCLFHSAIANHSGAIRAQGKVRSYCQIRRTIMSEILKKQSQTNVNGSSMGYYTTFIDLDRLAEFADAVEAKAAQLGYKVVANDAQVIGSKSRADGQNVCRYAVKFLNSIGKVTGTVAVWDTGKVSWAGFEPVELPRLTEVVAA
jgi:hypothetical protein